MTIDQVEGYTQEESHRMISGLTREELVDSIEEATKFYHQGEERIRELKTELTKLQNDDMASYVETLHGLSNITGTLTANKSEFFSRFRTEEAIAESEADDCEF